MLNKSILALLLVFAYGCASIDKSTHYVKTDEKSRMDYLNNHPELNGIIKDAIREGRIVKGMTREQAFAAYGETCSSFYDGNEVLAYAYNGKKSFKKSYVCSGEEKFYLRGGWFLSYLGKNM